MSALCHLANPKCPGPWVPRLFLILIAFTLPSNMESNMEVDNSNISYVPMQPLPTVHVPATDYDDHREAHTPLCIDNGSTHLRFGFCTSKTPRTGINMVAKYKERKTNKPLLLFGEGIDIEGGARSQAKTPWEGDVLLNFDALVRSSIFCLSIIESYPNPRRKMRWITRSSTSESTPQPWIIPSS